MESTLAQHVRSAAARSDVREAVGRVYANLQCEIDARRPVCSASGRCCRFEEFGHRLYVSTLELAAFVGGLGEEPQPIEAWDGTGCPFQVAKLCSVHAIRPFGCRMFFCDATSTAWQNERYEQFHAELKRLHETLDVPYFYAEWRQALVVLGLAGDGAGSCCRPRVRPDEVATSSRPDRHGPAPSLARGMSVIAGKPTGLSLPQL